VFASAATLVLTAVVLAQADPSPIDPTDLKILGPLAPFIGFLFWQLYRESKKREEAEVLSRQLYQSQLDKYEPAMRTMQTEMTAVLRDAIAEIAESRADRQARRPR